MEQDVTTLRKVTSANLDSDANHMYRKLGMEACMFSMEELFI
jgi:hypothetical protein